MTVSLTTRGRICPRSSKPLALLTWGFLCVDLRAYSFDDIGFGVPEFPIPCDPQHIYNKESPPVFDPSTAGLFATPSSTLVGSKQVSLLATRPSLVDPRSPGLYNQKAAQLTGTRVVVSVGKKDLLLSEPEEPTLTSSGTKAPDIFDKC